MTAHPANVAPGNLLLAALPPADRRRILALCESVDLVGGQVLAGADGVMAHAYFPTGAVVSLGIAPANEPRALEVALVGREGMVGLPLVMGEAMSSLRATVVAAGTALRIPAAPLRLQLEDSPALRTQLHRYLLVTLAGMAQAALCTRYHLVEERLARWLLMAQDRGQQTALHVTHELLAATLGVRRAGITRAAADLQRRRLIQYSRGELVIADRSGLQAAACRCYAADEAAYRRLMRRRPHG